MSEDTKPESQKPSKKVLVIAFMTIFLDLLGFGIIIPIQPFYAKSLGASATVVTLLGASYSVMQFFFSPFWERNTSTVWSAIWICVCPMILINTSARVHASVSERVHFIIAPLLWIFPRTTWILPTTTSSSIQCATW